MQDHGPGQAIDAGGGGVAEVSAWRGNVSILWGCTKEEGEGGGGLTVDDRHDVCGLVADGFRVAEVLVSSVVRASSLVLVTKPSLALLPANKRGSFTAQAEHQEYNDRKSQRSPTSCGFRSCW